MNKNAGIIGVETVEEHEDGSATFKFHMDADVRGLLAEEGLKLVMYCAAAKMDIQLVYDFILDHLRYTQEEEDSPPVSPKDVWKNGDGSELFE